MGTFNFGLKNIGNTDTYAHDFRDVYPYLVWGNNIEDYMEHTPYERFIWDKGNIYSNSCYVNSLEGSELIAKYEEFDLGDYSTCRLSIKGGEIPNEIVNAMQWMDVEAPYVAAVTRYISRGTLPPIDWKKFVNPLDNYTYYDNILYEELFNNVNFYVPGSYTIRVRLTDVVGNTQIVNIYVNIT